MTTKFNLGQSPWYLFPWVSGEDSNTILFRIDRKPIHQISIVPNVDGDEEILYVLGMQTLSENELFADKAEALAHFEKRKEKAAERGFKYVLVED